MAEYLARALWRKSTRSNGSGACVEIAPVTPGVVGLRDSKDPDGPVLLVAEERWAAFTGALRSGELDH